MMGRNSFWIVLYLLSLTVSFVSCTAQGSECPEKERNHWCANNQIWNSHGKLQLMTNIVRTMKKNPQITVTPSAFRQNARIHSKYLVVKLQNLAHLLQMLSSQLPLNEREIILFLICVCNFRAAHLNMSHHYVQVVQRMESICVCCTPWT